MSVGLISHFQCAEHDMGSNHPESPARLSAIQDHLISSGLDFALKQFDAIPASPEQLCLAHSQKYVDTILKNAPASGFFRLDADTLMTPHTLNAALLAAGAAIQAVDLVMQGDLSAAFCATRPPGHHAEKNKAMGFCFFNNVAIAAAWALKHYKLSKVAIVDFDVHHGNGTENIFLHDSNVLFCSTFQHPFYPFSGSGKKPSNIINTPLPANANSDQFRQAIKQYWLPALNQFEPEMLFISAGFDAHAEDQMSQVNLYEADYRWVTEQIKQVAELYCGGKIVSVLEGGYALQALGRSVVAHINGLIGH